MKANSNLMELIHKVARPIYEKLIAESSDIAEDMTFEEFCKEIELEVSCMADA